jgi:hypothetical protein
VAPATREQVGAVNRLLTDAAARPYMSTHDGQPPHLHYADEKADVVTRVRASTAAGLVRILAVSGGARHRAAPSSSTCTATAAAHNAHACAPHGSTSSRTANASGGRKAVHLDRAVPAGAQRVARRWLTVTKW